MIKLGEEGVAHLLVLIVLLLGIVVGVILIRNPDNLFTKFLAQASDETVVIVDEQGDRITTSTSATVKLKFSAPLWPSPTPISNQPLGPNDPKSAANVVLNSAYLNWKNPQWSLKRDDAYTSVATLGRGKLSNNLETRDFGFSVPAEATIKGIEAEILRGSTRAKGVVDKTVRIGLGGNNLSPENKAKAEIWPKTVDSVVYGGPADLWGLSLTPADVNNPNFAVTLQVGYSDSGSGSDTARVDNVRVTVHYSLPQPSTEVNTQFVTLAEDPNFTINVQTLTFTTDLTDFTFSNNDPGIKTLYAKFISSEGKEQNANPFPATVELTQTASFPQNGLVSYWSLDETNKTGVTGGIVDSQDGNPGTIPAGALVEDALGVLGNSKTFDGSNNSRIEIGDKSNLELTTFTIAGWVNLSGECGFTSCVILSKGQSANTGYSLSVSRINGSPYKAVLDIRDGMNKAVGTTNINTGQWYHIAGTSDGTKLQIFVNGVKETEVTQTVLPNFGSEIVKIGTRNGNNDLTTKGMIDEVGVWNRVLTDTEIDSLYRLAVKPTPTSIPIPTPPSSTAVNKKVMLLIYDPILSDGKRLHQWAGWNDPYQLAGSIISSLKTSSGEVVDYQISETQDRNEWPKMMDGYRFTESTYKDCLRDNSLCHNGGGLDYAQVWSDLDICQKVQAGTVDEVFILGAAHLGYDEFAFKIPADQMPYDTPSNYWFYEGRKKNIPDCNGKTVFVMGFNYERHLGEALESYGHRVESALALTVGRGFWEGCNGRNGIASDFDKFTCVNKDITSSTLVRVAGCGNAHYGPNSLSDYQYSSTTKVDSTCSSWDNYPSDLVSENIDCSVWGCEGLTFLKWWMSHFPKKLGVNANGNLNNWWRYIVDFDSAVTEAKGVPFP